MTLNATLASHDPDAGLSRLMSRSRNDIIYEIVRDRICLREYDEGYVIHETNLAVEFSVSRTPIRQVLQRLVFEQLVETRNGVGTIVAPVGPRFADMVRFRIGLTAMIADLVPLRLLPTLGSDYERLLDLAEQLVPDSPASESWNVWKSHHGLRASMIEDVALRQVDEMLFVRTARSWTGCLKEDAAGVQALVKAEIREIEGKIQGGTADSLFRLHAGHLDRFLAHYGAMGSADRK